MTAATKTVTVYRVFYRCRMTGMKFYLSGWCDETGKPLETARRNEAKTWQSPTAAMQQLCLATERSNRDWTADHEQARK